MVQKGIQEQPAQTTTTVGTIKTTAPAAPQDQNTGSGAAVHYKQLHMFAMQLSMANLPSRDIKSVSRLQAEVWRSWEVG